MLKNINLKFLDRFLFIYLWLFFSYTLINRIIPVAIFLNDTLNSIIFILFAGIGACFVIIDIFTTKYMFKAKYNWLLIIFLVIMGVSSLLNTQYGFFNNFKTVIWSAIHFLLFYSLGCRKNFFQKKTITRIFVLTMTIILSIAVSISIYQYIFQIGYEAVCNQIVYRQGFVENRLFGIFHDPNFAAVTSWISFLSSLYMLFVEKKRYVKLFLLLNMFLQFSYVVLSGSRSAFVAYLLTMVIVIFLFVRRFLIIHSHRDLRTVACIVCVIISFFCSLTFYHTIKFVYEYIPSVIGVNKDISILDRTDTEDLSNNRFEIWQDYLIATVENKKVWFGLSPRNGLAFIKDHYPNSLVAVREYSPHNAYISVFSHTGALGSIVIIALIVLSIKKVFHHVFILRDYDVNYIISLSIVGALASYAFFITDLFFVNNVSTIIFWTMLGYINNYQSKWSILSSNN